MSALNASALAEALADQRMLEAEKYEEFVNAMLPMCQDVPILAKELVYREWLTAFQVEQILAGNGPSLFLGSYVLIEPLGEGGMGRVFRARNWKLNRHVAIKVIREEQARQPGVVARFQREIRALGRVQHPNIVMAIDADFQPGSIWYAMEFVEGMDLGRYLRTRGPMPIADACEYVVQIADALQHAHDCGLVHRDIKPSNLILCESERSIKLLDLGLTRFELPVNDPVFAQLTRVGTIIGTPDFIAPEQIKDSRSADIRSDLYSLGCTFYFLLTGRAPFEDVEAVVDKLISQCENEPTPVERLRADIPDGLAGIVRKLMAKRRRDRFQSSAELISAMLDLRHGVTLTSRDTFIDASLLTLTDSPPIQRELPPTQLLDRSDIEFPIDTSEAEVDVGSPKPKQGRRVQLARIGLAVLIATLALVIFWQAVKGPGSVKVKQAPANEDKSGQKTEDDAGAPAAPDGGAPNQ